MLLGRAGGCIEGMLLGRADSLGCIEGMLLGRADSLGCIEGIIEGCDEGSDDG